eukprot:Pgem_evm1s1954
MVKIGINKNKDGLQNAPNAPFFNCVYSKSERKYCKIEPFTISEKYIENPEAYQELEPTKVITKVLAKQEGCKVVTDNNNDNNDNNKYTHAIFQTKVLKFKDDVEFLCLEGEPGVMHVRSASRVGCGDNGLNRKRVEMLRKAYNNELKTLENTIAPSA